MDTVSTEAHAEAPSSCLGKRKAENEDSVDSSDSKTRIEIERGGSSSQPHHWGYDSFEGVEYFSISEEEFFDEESNQKFLRYRRQCIESQGFDVDRENIPLGMIGGICEIINMERESWMPNLTLRQCLAKGATLCLDKYNDQFRTNWQVDHVVKANARGCHDIKYYITFVSKHLSDGSLVQFQAKFGRQLGSQEEHPIFCRPKPKQKD